MHLVQRKGMISSLSSEKYWHKKWQDGASEGKQSTQINSRLISLSQQCSWFKTDSEENCN